MKGDIFINLCKELILNYVNNNISKRYQKQITKDDVFIVWSCKTLQNNKALVSTTISDGMYYELTYNGDKESLYIDAYKKWDKVVVDLSKEKN